MLTTYVLDTGPLGLLSHSKHNIRASIETWLSNEMANGATIFIAEIADFEVRRELIRLIRAGKLPPSTLDRLNQLKTIFRYLEVTTTMWYKAAEFWADSRLRGLPTASPDALDCDAIIAAQAAEMQATVLTTNAAHIFIWVPVKIWP
jgi:predicted nucleic acid-binding protein